MSDTARQPIVVTHDGGVRFIAQVRSHRFAYEGMRVEVEQRKASNPSRIGTFAARVVLPTALPPAHAELLERVARSCPAHGTLTHPAQVLLTIESPAEAAA